MGGKPAYELANGCYALRSRQLELAVVENGDGSYSATAEETADAEPFRLQATGLGKYLLYGEGRDFMAAQGDDVRVDDEPSNETVWEISLRKKRGHTLYSREANKVVAADPNTGDLGLIDADDEENAVRFCSSAPRTARSTRRRRSTPRASRSRAPRTARSWASWRPTST